MITDLYTKPSSSNPMVDYQSYPHTNISANIKMGKMITSGIPYYEQNENKKEIVI